jgi:MoxR-like ATPase
MIVDTSQVLDEMELDDLFRATKIYRRQLVRDACARLGIANDNSVQNALIGQSEKLRHGVYKLTGVASVKPTPIKKEAIVKIQPLQLVSTPTQAPHALELAISLTTVSVPKAESGYVPFGSHKDVERVIASRRFFPVYITGPSGTGKSSMVINICAKNSIPMIRINCSVQSDEEKLIGSKTLVNGDIKVIDGSVVTGMRTGALVILEEADALDTRLALTLQGILEGRPFFFALTGEYITPAPGFNIVAIGNTKGSGSEDGKYLGTNLQNSAFLERFGCTFEQDFPSQNVEQKMVMNWMQQHDCVDESLAAALVKWTDVVRKTHKSGGIEDVISTRRLNHIVVAYSIYRNITKAVELCTNRFDSFTSTAFRDLFDKIYVEPLTSVPALESA